MSNTAEQRMSIDEIVARANVFSQYRAALAGRVDDLNTALDQLKREHLPAIREMVKDAAGAKDALREALEAAPELFDKPRTRVLAGIKVGYTKQRGKVELDDEAAVIRRIREKLPLDQAELLIRVRESVHKPAVYDLTAADLKRLGIRVTADEDVVVIKPMDSEIDKLVDALLADADRLEEESES